MLSLSVHTVHTLVNTWLHGRFVDEWSRGGEQAQARLSKLMLKKLAHPMVTAEEAVRAAFPVLPGDQRARPRPHTNETKTSPKENETRFPFALTNGFLLGCSIAPLVVGALVGASVTLLVRRKK